MARPAYGGPADQLLVCVRHKACTLPWLQVINGYFSDKQALLAWCTANRVAASFDYDEQGFTREVIRSVSLRSLAAPGVSAPGP